MYDHESIREFNNNFWAADTEDYVNEEMEEFVGKQLHYKNTKSLHYQWDMDDFKESQKPILNEKHEQRIKAVHNKVICIILTERKDESSLDLFDSHLKFINEEEDIFG